MAAIDCLQLIHRCNRRFLVSSELLHVIKHLSNLPSTVILAVGAHVMSACIQLCKFKVGFLYKNPDFLLFFSGWDLESWTLQISNVSKHYDTKGRKNWATNLLTTCVVVFVGSMIWIMTQMACRTCPLSWFLFLVLVLPHWKPKC